MRDIDIVKGLVFKKLELNIDTFQQRLISQKKIFLLQELGVNLGYAYSWYVRGPYSSDLTTYMYDNLKLLNEFDFNGISLSINALETILTVNDMLNNKPEDLTDSSWYELLASVLYINKYWSLKESDKLFLKLIEHKPQFSEKQFKQALETLKKNYECEA